MSCVALESALLIFAIVLLIGYYALDEERTTHSGFLSGCFMGMTTGMMPSIDEPPPRMGGAGGIGQRGAAQCCGAFEVPPIAMA